VSLRDMATGAIEKNHKKKLAEASSIPMYYQCFVRVPSAHAICVVP
jgi:hypothetical protein